MKAKTPTIKATDVSRSWYIVDVSEAPLGRVATQVATRLSGKHKPSYTPHIDNGDYVVVINADKLQVTGAKGTQKEYYRHSGHPGNLKTTTLDERIAKGDSTGVVRDAIKGMLPKNKLQAERLKRLKVFPGAEHPHTPQNPNKLEVG